MRAAHGRTEKITTWMQLFQQKGQFQTDQDLACYVAVLQFLSSISCIWQHIRVLDSTQVIHFRACVTPTLTHGWQKFTRRWQNFWRKKKPDRFLQTGPEGTWEDSLIPMCTMQKNPKKSPSFTEAKNCCPESKLHKSSYSVFQLLTGWVGSVCALFQVLGKTDTHSIDASFFVTPWNCFKTISVKIYCKQHSFFGTNKHIHLLTCEVSRCQGSHCSLKVKKAGNDSLS